MQIRFQANALMDKKAKEEKILNELAAVKTVVDSLAKEESACQSTIQELQVSTGTDCRVCGQSRLEGGSRGERARDTYQVAVQFTAAPFLSACCGN